MSEDLFAQMAEDSAVAALRNAPDGEKAQAIRAVGVELVQIDARIARGEQLLAELKTRREQIMRRDLVDAMDAVGMDVMGLAEFEVDIKTGEYVFASLPNPDTEKDPEIAERKRLLREAGLKWLVDNDFSDLIKTTVVVELPRGAYEQAQRIKQYVEAMPPGDGSNEPAGYSAKIEESVHWGTLTSFVKEQLKRPEVVLPLEQLGAVVGRIAKIVKRKKR